MAIVEYSPAMMTNGITWMFSPMSSYSSTQSTSNASASFFPYSPAATYPNTVIGIHIMTGTMPTDFSTLTTFSARSADRLVSFLGTDTFSGAAYVNNKWVLSTPNIIAVASGTATWFWAVSTMSNSTSSSTIYQQFMGTVGVSGSGADLTISDTAIVSGNPYRITALTVNVSPTYTV